MCLNIYDGLEFTQLASIRIQQVFSWFKTMSWMAEQRIFPEVKVAPVKSLMMDLLAERYLIVAIIHWLQIELDPLSYSC